MGGSGLKPTFFDSCIFLRKSSTWQNIILEYRTDMQHLLYKVKSILLITLQWNGELVLSKQLNGENIQIHNKLNSVLPLRYFTQQWFANKFKKQSLAISCFQKTLQKHMSCSYLLSDSSALKPKCSLLCYKLILIFVQAKQLLKFWSITTENISHSIHVRQYWSDSKLKMIFLEKRKIKDCSKYWANVEIKLRKKMTHRL